MQYTYEDGLTTGTLKSRKWKTRELKSRHQNARLVIAGEGKVWKAKVLIMCF